MKLTLKKKPIKNLSIDEAVLPSDATAQIAGGHCPTDTCSLGCPPNATDNHPGYTVETYDHCYSNRQPGQPGQPGYGCQPGEPDRPY
ncbi:hypothetical protein [Shewanella sp. 10N.286.54.B9]|uniref:hypothetical protein n=1 Tax=Shewanella sp. 10N.286.54.B9 TaxID=3229719 RepID=UPI003551F6E5